MPFSALWYWRYHWIYSVFWDICIKFNNFDTLETTIGYKNNKTNYGAGEEHNKFTLSKRLKSTFCSKF